MRSVFFILIMLLTVTFLLTGQTLREEEDYKNISVYMNRVQWNSTKYRVNKSQPKITQFTMKTADYFGWSFMEYAKFTVRTGYNNPQYNFRFFLNFFKYVVYYWLFTITFPIIIPLLALLYLIGKYVINLFKRLKK